MPRTPFALWPIVALAAFLPACDRQPPPPAPASRPAATPPELGDVMTNALGMKLAYVPPGELVMGSPLAEPGRHDDEAQHGVVLTRGFWIGVTEVTQAQWNAVMAPAGTDAEPNDLPVVRVKWGQAVAFCRTLSERDGNQYRLPTEAEWEHACRAGTTGPFAGAADEVAWHMDNSDEALHAVAGKKPNAWGLYDMHGNAAEWCADRYGPYAPGEAVDPTGPAEGTYRVVRGGSFGHFSRACRSAARASYNPAYGLRRVGFRIVMEQPPAASAR